jgi:multiple sugar transport system permease protein
MTILTKIFVTRNPLKPSPATAAVSYLLLGIWTVVVLFPLYWLLVTAFKAPADVYSGPKYVPFVDYQPTLAAWNELLLDPTAGNIVARPYVNTVIVGTISALLSLIIGSCAAYALLRFQYHPKPGLIAVFAACVLLAVGLAILGVPWLLAVVIAIAVFILLAQTIGRRFKGTMDNSDITFWLISQRMLPPIVTVIPIYILFQNLRMLDSREALIICYCAANLPLAVWFMRDYLTNIPIELEESAYIDGATRYQVLSRIVLPLSTPGLVATFLIILVFTWNEYTLALFLSGANAQTMPYLVYAQNATRGPQIAAAIALERFIARGLLIGAVKS